jgi:predicted SAM-dependent methyltransferase
MNMELLIGAGSTRDKRIHTKGRERWNGLVTLDINDDHQPDVVWDLTNFPLPFVDNQFDEIHAYEVLEHTGAQGDYKFFFAQFTEFWRILKPNGMLFGTCPHWKSVWAWGDPSHTRVIQKEQFMFLSQQEYKNQIGKTPMSDFRYIYQADFETEMVQETEVHLLFALKAIKPSRIREST